MKTTGHKKIGVAVTKRAYDYKAQIENRPGCWGCGHTTLEAIGDLIHTHAEQFGIEITWPK